MSMGIGNVPDHLNIRRPTGRVDPVVAKALASLEEKKLKEWAEANSISGKSAKNNFDKYKEDYREKLDKYLKDSDAGTLRTATRRLRRELGSEVERLLFSNPTIYATVLANAVAKQAPAVSTSTSPPPSGSGSDFERWDKLMRELVRSNQELVAAIALANQGEAEAQHGGPSPEEKEQGS